MLTAQTVYLSLVPVDRMQLLAWIADRETVHPGVSLHGTTLMQEASGLAGDDGLPWPAVARAMGELRKLELIDWTYHAWPNESSEPPAHLIDDRTAQRTVDIMVTEKGYSALAARQAKDRATQVSIVNSTVGQLALGDISNIDVFVILDAAERALDRLDAPAEAKEEARRTIRRMRDAGAAAISSVAREVLAAAVRQGLGLP